jgi:hypothetical protein
MSETVLKSEAEVRALFDSIPIPKDLLDKKLPEWRQLERLSIELVRTGEVRVLGWADDGKYRLPLIGMSFGNRAPDAPVLALYGGVHGLERIGAQVVLSLIRSFAALALWDKLLQDALTKIRIVFFPIVNPLGMFHKTRANPAGVDLMRNAPIESDEAPTWLVGGHRLSPHLPWYRGLPDQPLQPEAQALIDFTMRECFQSPRVILLDFHSGFGTNDQIWFPYAKSRKPFPHLAELHSLKDAFERTHPHHFYKIEPQAKNYTTHGDLWDYLYDLYTQQDASKKGIFLPLAVEMGSWAWVRKNPLQMFSLLGAFNPMVPHRLKRILRRHMTLFDFMVRALVSPSVWVPSQPEQRDKHHERALDLWYGEPEN